MGEIDGGGRLGTRIVRRRGNDRQTRRTRRRFLHNRRRNGPRPATARGRRGYDRSRPTRAVRLFRYVSVIILYRSCSYLTDLTPRFGLLRSLKRKSWRLGRSSRIRCKDRILSSRRGGSGLYASSYSTFFVVLYVPIIVTDRNLFIIVPHLFLYTFMCT